MCINEFIAAIKSSQHLVDWMMVVINAAYLFATICIFRTNRAATQAAQDQVAEMKLQFDETKRLEVIPYLYASWEVSSYSGYFLSFDATKSFGGDVKLKHVIFTFANSGKGPATNIHCTIESDAEAKDTSLPSTISPALTTNLPVIIAYDLSAFKRCSEIPFKFDLSYNDLLGNSYHQSLKFSLYQDQSAGNKIFIKGSFSSEPQIAVKSENSKNS